MVILFTSHNKGWVWLSSTSPWIDCLLYEFYATSTVGHSGTLCTYKRLSQTFYWVKMKMWVQDYVAICETCPHKYPGPYLHLASSNLPIPEHICFNIYMDFIEGLPTSHRKLVISVVVDRLSKYAHLVAPSNPYTVASIAQVIDKKITRLHGMPKSIMS